MNEDFRTQIHYSLDLRETEELLQIWQDNDRVEWSDEAFEAISDILLKRGLELPSQEEPVFVHETDEQEFRRNLTEREIRIIDDENPPEFYAPFEVFKFSRWIELAAKVMIVLPFLTNLLHFAGYKNLAQAYFPQHANFFLVYVIAIAIAGFDSALAAAIAYFPLMALSRILKVLMEMEFNSRKPVASYAEAIAKA